MGRRGEDKTVSNSVKFEFDYNQEGRLIKMHNKKYGIWKTRYAENSRNIFEDWVRRDGEPVLFSTERGSAGIYARYRNENAGCVYGI